MPGFWNAHSDLDWYAETIDVGQEPFDAEDEEPMSEQDDDAGILAAAKALCWAARPAGFDEQHDIESCWLRHSEMDQRLFLYRARVAVVAWEDWKGQKG